MSDALIPRPDTITVAWGWFQFLLLLTFPVHLLAMNAMVGGLAIGVVQHFKGGPLRLRLAHRLALLLPLVIAFAVNFGVAPLLFSQVLYGHLFYTSSILMGPFWLAIVPVLILAYYGAYLYDFRFQQLAGAGRWLALVILLALFTIGFLFVNNMLLMILPERFAAYFSNMGGSLPALDHPVLLPRYLHMMTGAVAVGGLFVALAGRFQADRDPELAAQAREVGMQTFFWGTAVNVLNGLWFLLAQPREIMLIFMGGNILATICFTVALLVVAIMLVTAWKKRLWPTFWLALTVVFLMTFLRAWLRTGYLQEVFNLGRLQVVPEYSPMWFFFAILLLGLICIAWMLKKTGEAMANS